MLVMMMRPLGSPELQVAFSESESACEPSGPGLGLRLEVTGRAYS